MKSFQQFQEDQSKNPFIDQKTGRQEVGPFDYGHNPPIHKLKSGNRYPNNILDKTGSKELDNYYKEPEVMKFFKDNDNSLCSFSSSLILSERILKSANISSADFPLDFNIPTSFDLLF